MIQIAVEVDDNCDGKVKCKVSTNRSLDIANALAHIEAVKVRLINAYIDMTNDYIQKTKK